MPSRYALTRVASLPAAALLLVNCATPANPPAPAATAAQGGGAPVAAQPSSVPAAQASAAPSALPSTGSPEQSQVRIVYATNSGEDEFLNIAQEQGYFRKYGLSADYSFAEAQAGIAALLSGEAQLALADPASTVQAASQGAPLKMVAFFNQTSPYAILSAPDVSIPGDLKGKTIAIGKIGDTSDVSARIGLSAIGLQMGQDVTPVPVGSSPDRYAALLTGQVSAAIEDATAYVDQAQAKGMHVLVNLQDQKIPYASSALVVQVDYGQSHPNTVEAVLKALMGGTAYYADEANKETALQLIGNDLHLPASDPKVAQAYDAYHTRTAGDPFPNTAAIDTILKALQSIDPAAYQRITDDDLIDPRYMQELRDQGFQPSER